MRTAEPESVGLSTARLARVDALTHGYVDSGRLPGVITVIIRNDEIVHHDVYGMASIDEGEALTHDSIFRIYSMTKPITSVALMMLYEAGEVLLENPVSRYIPEFADTEVWAGGTEEAPVTEPVGREMTVHDVLTHMSGLTAGFQYVHPVDAIYRRFNLGDLTRPNVSLAEGCAQVAALPLLFSPGTKWGYGMSTDVVGRIVEVISGQTLGTFLSERIFEPLGMVDTGFHVPKGDLHRFTSLYVRNKRKELRALDHAAATALCDPPIYESGAGGLMSTAADYVKFTRMLAGRGQVDGVRLLGSRTVAFMAANHLPGGRLLNEMGQATFSEVAMEGTGFGLGFAVVTDPAAAQSMGSAGEFSWGGAASTAFWVDPVEDLSVVFLTQLLPSNTFPIRRQLRSTVYQALID